jgi:hypothetical protein
MCYATPAKVSRSTSSNRFNPALLPLSGDAMTIAFSGEQCMGFDPQHLEPRERLAAFLRSSYSAHGAKGLARDIRCDVRTAENILSGHWPSSRLWSAIAATFGHDVLSAVFDPDIHREGARLRAEIREVRNELERREAALRALDGGRAGVGARPARPHGEA